MKIVVQFLFAALFCMPVLKSQTTIPTLDMESWDQFSGYDEPSGGVWTTANSVVLLNPPIVAPTFHATTSKTADAHSGDWAAKIETKETTPPLGSPLLLSGALATGVFEANIANPANSLKFGVPYTGKPTRFKGWYKYLSVNNDSCDIFVILSRYDTISNQRVQLAREGIRDSAIVSDWTEWDFPINYTGTETPDSISIVFSSSAGGALLQGQVGSTLFIDDISLEMGTGVEVLMMPEVSVRTFPNPSTGLVNISLNKSLEKAEFILINQLGQEMAQEKFKGDHFSFDLSSHAQGVYYYKLLSNGNHVYTGMINHLH